MPYYSKDEIARAREMDLLTYLETYEPAELVHVRGSTYTTASHDSLKISNGKWMWWSRGFGGASALDYLVKVRGESFTEAVGKILGQSINAGLRSASDRPERRAPPEEQAKRKLLLPERSPDDSRVRAYLRGRGISYNIIDECIREGLLYESLPYHNCIFVGHDAEGTARYACYRATSQDRIMGDAAGSDKRYAFRIPGTGNGDELHVFESAIDLLSYGAILEGRGVDWRRDNLLSLGGVYAPPANGGSGKVPAALANFLEAAPAAAEIVLHLDNDHAGRAATERIRQILEGRYHIRDEPPMHGKDMNDELRFLLRQRTVMRKERQDYER